MRTLCVCLCVERNVEISIWSSAFYSDLCVCVWFGYRCRAVSVACHVISQFFFSISACIALCGFVIHHIRLWYKIWLIYKTLYLRGSHVLKYISMNVFVYMYIYRIWRNTSMSLWLEGKTLKYVIGWGKMCKLKYGFARYFRGQTVVSLCSSKILMKDGYVVR